MDIIGLTGGIASGKSTVARMLIAADIDVVDADQLAREVVAPGTDGLAEIVARFGADVVRQDGGLDRDKLGAIIFDKAEARLALNLIVHPRVAEATAARMSAFAEAGKARAVYEVPLLFENNLEDAMSATVLVAVPEDVQLARLMARDGLSETAARSRIAAQLPLADKRARATYVIENGGPLAETATQLRAVWRRLSGDDVAFREPDA